MTPARRNMTFGLHAEVKRGKLEIRPEGKVRKFVNSLEQRSFSAPHACQSGQEVLYITERAVFRLNREGLALIEIAPGVDIETQVLALMDFVPVAGEVAQMPALRAISSPSERV